jgi:serine/threonine protein kinase
MFVEKVEAFAAAAAAAEGALFQRCSRLESTEVIQESENKELGAWRRMRAQAQHMMELVTEIKALSDADEPAASLCELERLQKENKACRRKVGRARRDKANAQDDLDEADEAADTEAAEEARAELSKAELVSTAARRTLHVNSTAMQTQVVRLVRLASRQFPELEATEDVKNFMGSGGLLGPERRQLDDYDNVRPLATKGRNELKQAVFDGREVCLKRFPLQDDMKNYLKEIKNVQKLKHPYIISYGAVFQDCGSMYVQMEFFAHGSLRQWVDTTSPSIPQKRGVLRQLLLAIACIHSQNIVHCDLKNENVLISADETPRLCDFEMSKDLDGSASTFFGGSPGFIAPEILSGKLKYSAASDMYAFGVLLLNTLRSPAPGEPYPHTDLESLPAAVDFSAKIKPGVVGMLHQDPARRPTAAQTLADYFESGSEASVCPDGWTTKDGFACVDLSAETLMIKLMDLSLLATAKELATTSASDSMKKARVQRVVRIENRLLFEDYQRERKKIAQRLSGSQEAAAGVEMLSGHQPAWFSTDDLERFIMNELSQSSGTGQNFQFPEDDSAEINEFYLWHGLPATIVLEDGTTHETWRIIAQHGFDERIGGDTNGELYGSGCYFADASSKSNQYSKNTVNEDGHHCMLRCRVVMGDPYMAQKPYKGRRPPLNEATPGLPYDSIFAEENVTVNGGPGNGGKQFHNEYVVFNGAQVYPEYAVFYTL